MAASHVAIEAAGHPAALATAYAATRSGGRVVVAGLPHPRHEVGVPIASLVAEEKSILGSYMGSSVPRRDLPRLFDLYAAGLLPADALVTSRSVPLDDVNVALDRLHAGAEVRQILTPDGQLTPTAGRVRTPTGSSGADGRRCSSPIPSLSA